MRKLEVKPLAVVSAFLGLSGLLPIIAAWIVAKGDISLLFSPDQTFALAHAAPIWLKVGNLGDMFGYYLLLVPILVGLHSWWRSRGVNESAQLVLILGLLYCYNGAIGAARSAQVMYFLASQPLNEANMLAYQVHTVDVQSGMWATLGSVSGGFFWIGAGLIYWRLKQKGFGVATMVLGASYLLQGELFNDFLPAGLALVFLAVYLLGALVWQIVAALKLPAEV